MDRLFTNSEYLKLKERGNAVDIRQAQDRAVADACGGGINISLLDPGQDRSFIRVSYLDGEGSWQDINKL